MIFRASSRASHSSASANWSSGRPPLGVRRRVDQRGDHLLGFEAEPFGAGRTHDGLAQPVEAERPGEVEGGGHLGAQAGERREAGQEVASRRRQEPYTDGGERERGERLADTWAASSGAASVHSSSS